MAKMGNRDNRYHFVNRWGNGGEFLFSVGAHDPDPTRRGSALLPDEVAGALE